MKKLFTVDDIMVSIVAALGYGFGETIARLSGWPEILCIAASLALGIALEGLTSRIVFCKAVQEKQKNRVFAYTAIILVFLAAQYISVRWMGVSMAEYVQGEFLYVVGLPIIGFFVNLLIRSFRTWQIRKLYGDGSDGYVFDVTNEEIEEVNRQNRPIVGKYDTSCAVKTRTGIFVGEKQKKIIYYLGIPYAKPPVGDLRWKAPEPLPASEAVFEAVNFGASAIQAEHPGVILKHHRQSEDCLSLNICVGAKKTEEKKPVLVAFHHGDFTYGGSADPLMIVNNHPEIVFVSFNYRLGIFGFIDFSEVPGGEDYPDAPNLGLLDQIAALRWIKENIEAFGGDPDRITVIGFESGAASVCLLAASERARGLFRKALVLFGSPEMAYDTPKASRALAKSLLAETQTTTMEELSALSTETLKAANGKLWKSLSAPTCDGSLIPADVYRAYQEGAASGIDFIIGISGDERHVIRSFVGGRNYEDYISAAAADMQSDPEGPSLDELREYTGTQPDSPAGLEKTAELVEQWTAQGIYYSAEKLSEGGSHVHLMYWNEKPLIEKLGSGTTDAAAALLGNRDASLIYGNVMNADLSEILQTFLIKFMNGNDLELYPNEIRGVDAIYWKAFPKALIISDGKCVCDTIEDRLVQDPPDRTAARQEDSKKS